MRRSVADWEAGANSTGHPPPWSTVIHTSSACEVTEQQAVKRKIQTTSQALPTHKARQRSRGYQQVVKLVPHVDDAQDVLQETNRKINRLNIAADREQLASPQIIQPEGAKRHPNPHEVKVINESGHALGPYLFVELVSYDAQLNIYNIESVVTDVYGIYRPPLGVIAILTDQIPDGGKGRAFIGGVQKVYSWRPYGDEIEVGDSVGYCEVTSDGNRATRGGPLVCVAVEEDTDYIWVRRNA